MVKVLKENWYLNEDSELREYDICFLCYCLWGWVDDGMLDGWVVGLERRKEGRKKETDRL